ncbi:hypothetical protein CCAX7_000530 [Capsulimonas corticalis]|uniref:Uncharacterized protein n=1 Tax=Capsulimonas corticalis TaxID=2219043 RepID=A0A402CRC0_9BACT|nr:hypothetical protein [Capsulimonas corticalis]BDI28002.1 hypothetical protein CCAX7_000530 [Capsulimonas corticalis]
MQTPPGTIQSAEPVIYDEVTLRRWTRTRTAAQWALDYYQDKGEWPAIKQIAGRAGVSTGTAHNALKQAKSGIA